ncbi:MAG TPA: HAMP domain-containing sensor histidine kinase [Phycisphaerales bacterium]|nr:HAMP domain-containing sensor histidine kinase [Phycisphaerales bacterium]
MWRGLSLAQKCLLVFGTAIVLVVLAALTVPWLRMTKLIDAGQQDISHQMVITWEALGRAEAATSGVLPLPNIPARQWPLAGLEPYGTKVARGGIMATRLTVDQATELARVDPFIARALAAFRDDATQNELQAAQWSGTTREYRYAKADRVISAGTSRLVSIVVLERRSVEATRLLLSNTIYLLGAGAAVLLPALLVLYIITQKLILQPVRALRDTAQRVQEGNVAIRSEIRTGDEFEHLAETFNSMLNDLQVGQDRLRSINSALDLKLHELAESNSSLYHAAKVKGEFLANVSHELRTPLNSIIGFAELLMEVARNDLEREPTPGVQKRIRYLENILTAGKNLLNLINTLLEMSRIEAGRVELSIERMNLRDACEGLIGLIAPIADKRGVQLKLEVGEDLPVVSTDPRKFQQVVFNFLSNAVKFVEPMERTGRQPQVTLRAERLRGSGGPDGGQDRVRVSVIDNGPGIPREEQEKVFEKFYQLDGGHTREHTGTGLGLAISKELAQILQSEIQLVSEVGRGSMFSLIMPLQLGEEHAEVSALEAKFRGSLTSGRGWEG